MINSSKTIVVLGASYGGARAARLLAESIPDNWRIIVIERNSHANHLYVIPRYTVVSGHEHKAFIPYTNLFGPCPSENLILHASVTKLSSHSVTISRSFPQFGLSNQIPFDYCIYALGSHLPAPIDVWGENEESHEENVDVLGDDEVEDTEAGSKARRKKFGTKQEGMAWLKRGQKKIKEVDNVLVIGGGALGIQFASDIKDVYPEKHVTLIHSRPRLLPRFDPLMHSEIARGLEDLGVELLLSTRVDLASLSEHSKQSADGHNNRTVRTTTGRSITADLVLLCTGQTPNTALLREFAPETIDESSGYARVNRALQLLPIPSKLDNKCNLADMVTHQLNILDLNEEEIESTPYEHIFVVGDAADSFGAIKAGYNAYYQAEVAARNIMHLITNSIPSECHQDVRLEEYEPGATMIKVSMGLKKAVFQSDKVIGWKEDQNEDLDAPLIWKYYGADPEAAGGMMR